MAIRRHVPAAIFSLSILVGSMFAVPALASDGYQETRAGTPPDSASGCLDENRIQGVTFTSRPTQERGMSFWGVTCFLTSHDMFWLRDERSDGMSIGVQWKIIQRGHVTRSGLIRDKRGRGVDSILDKDFPEHVTLMWRLGACDATGQVINCHSPGDYVDWEPQVSGGQRLWLCTSTSDGQDGDFCLPKDVVK